MKQLFPPLWNTRRFIAGFRRDENGAALVEYALVLPLFFLLFFGILDFGRMAGNYVVAQKATERAARITAVRLPACPGVPLIHERIEFTGGGTPPKFGTSCSVGGICVNPGDFTCTADVTNATADEVWTLIRPVLPSDATPANLRFTYSFDERLGFVGGPYVPVVTLEIENLDFEFVTPLAALAALATAGLSDADPLSGTVPFPSMSTTLPAEDLALGSGA